MERVARMGGLLPFLFRVPTESQSLIQRQIAELHYQRMTVVVPLLVVLGIVFLVLDVFLLVEPGNSFLPWFYFVEDVLFLLFQVAFLFRLSQGPRRVNVPEVHFYVGFILAWGCLAGNIEFLRTGGFTTIFLTMIGVAALGLFSARGSLILILATSTFFLILNLGWLGGKPFALEEYFAFAALPFLAFAISHTLYTAVVQNLLKTLDLSRAHDELKQIRLNLIRQDKMASLGVLSGGLAHEIQAPLEGLKAHLASGEFHPDEGDVSSAMLRHIQRIEDLIRTLGQFARETPSGTEEPYDLNQGVLATVAMTRFEAAPDVVVETDLSDVPILRARGSEINQALLNLVLNAIQAVRTLPEGKVRLVMVRTRREPESVVAEVVNSGPPVPEAHRERIFEPFFSTKAPGAGTGLGLSLAWQIVHRHGGELELDEKEPVTFRIRLPLDAGPSSV